MRRAKRLLPAFVVVALATIAVSGLVLSPSRMVDFTNSLFFAAFGLSNMYFMFQDPYWADSSSTLPLLHTWSLGVEEQFYLLFPALLVISGKFFAKWPQVALFSLLAGLTFLLAHLVSGFDPTYAFYLLPTRAWELLVGVVLALVTHHWKILVPRVIATLSAGLGILLIASSYLYLGQFITGPEVLTSVPVLGVALIILGGLRSNPVSKALGIRPLVALGLISYSLYLWHYPILALGRVNAPLGPRGEILGVGLAVVMAVATYFVVERPFRRVSFSRLFIGFTIVGLSSVLAFTFGSLATSGYEARTGTIPLAQTPELDSRFGQVISAGEGEGMLLLFGDSHMQRLRLSLSKSANQFGLDFLDGTQTACPFFEGITRLDRESCSSKFQAKRLALAATMEPSFVVLGGRFPLSIEGSRFNNMEGGVENGAGPAYVLPGSVAVRGNQKSLVQDSIRRTIRSMLEQGHTVVLVYPIPEVGWQVPDEISRRAKSSSPSGISELPVPGQIKERLLPNLLLWPLENAVTTSYDVYVDRAQSSFDALDSITSDSIIRVYPHKIFCEDREGGRCMTHDNENVFYTDDDHLSSAGANLLTEVIMKEISEWDAKP